MVKAAPLCATRYYRSRSFPGMPRYFAYGSNMSASQMRDRCPGAVPAGIASLPGYRLAFTRYSVARAGGVADIRPRDGAVTYGVLWHVTDEHLASLDQFEGVARGAYHRLEVRVESPAGPVGAITYQVDEPRPEHVPPAPDYLATLLEGAREHHLPEAYVHTLQALASPTAGS